MCAVEPWVKTHKKILELSTGWTIGEKDTTDDRLARVVEEIGKQEEVCTQIKMKLGRNLIREDFVFLADSKASSLATRGQIAASGGIYCFPLPMTGQTPQFLQQWVLNPPSEQREEIRLPDQTPEEPGVGKGFEKVDVILKRHKVKDFFVIKISDR